MRKHIFAKLDMESTSDEQKLQYILTFYLLDAADNLMLVSTSPEEDGVLGDFSFRIDNDLGDRSENLKELAAAQAVPLTISTDPLFQNVYAYMKGLERVKLQALVEAAITLASEERYLAPLQLGEQAVTPLSPL